MAALKWANKENLVCVPLSNYVTNIEEKEKVWVNIFMWQVYFTVKFTKSWSFLKSCVFTKLATITIFFDFGH